MFRKIPRESVLVALLVVITVVVVGSVVDWHRLSVDAFDGSLNDQVGYVGVARNFADHRSLDSNIIYPVLLRQHVLRTSLYMPGFYWALAATYRCFGYSAVTSRLPALIGFLLAVWLTYYIGRKLYDSRAAALGCTLFAVFPLDIVYAFTAMMEQSLVAAGLAAFALFLRAGERARVWMAPLALVLPLLLRETGVILGIVMLAMILGTKSEGGFRRAAICAVLMPVVLAVVLVSPISAGRPSLWKANLLVSGNPEEVYGDAFATDKVPAQLSDWASAVRDTFAYNAKSLVRPQGDSSGFFEQSVVWFILSGIPLGLALWFLRKDSFALGVCVAVAVLALALLAVYMVWGYRGMRVLLILHPFVAILWGAVLQRIVRPRWAQVVAMVALFALGTWGAVHLVRSQAQVEADSKANTAFVASVVKNGRGLLVSPFWLTMDYLNEHYPQKWSFVPSNCRTARLLDERYRIGTLIMPVPEGKAKTSPAPEYCGTGLKLSGKQEFNGTEFVIYRR